MKLQKNDEIITTYNQKVIPSLLAQGYVIIENDTDEQPNQSEIAIKDEYSVKKKRL